MNPPRFVHSAFARRAVALLCASLAPCVALAQGNATASESPWYVILNAGTSTMSDPLVTLGSVSGRLELGPGSSFGGAVGRRFGDSLRGELEISYRNNTVKGASVSGIDPSQTDSDLAALFMMANFYYDFAPIQAGPARLRPYVGVGLGFAQEADADLRAQGAAAQFSGSGAAWQVALGVNWNYGSRWIAGVGLRYTDAGRIDLSGAGAVAGQTLDLRYRSVTASASIGYRF